MAEHRERRLFRDLSDMRARIMIPRRLQRSRLPEQLLAVLLKYLSAPASSPFHLSLLQTPRHWNQILTRTWSSSCRLTFAQLADLLLPCCTFNRSKEPKPTPLSGRWEGGVGLGIELKAAFRSQGSSSNQFALLTPSFGPENCPAEGPRLCPTPRAPGAAGDRAPYKALSAAPHHRQEEASGIAPCQVGHRRCSSS